MKKYLNSRTIAANGVVAALYAAITIACSPLSYSYMQLRFSEMLNLLVFFNPSYTIGLTLGCLISNIFSSNGPIDIALGTLATFISCLLMIVYSRFIKNLFSSGFIPCLINAIMVPFIIYLSSVGTSNSVTLTPAVFFTMFGWVFLGEFICIIAIGYPIFLIICKKNQSFKRLIQVTRNEDFKW